MVRKTAIAIDTIINQKKFNEGTDESECWFSQVKDCTLFNSSKVLLKLIYSSAKNGRAWVFWGQVIMQQSILAAVFMLFLKVKHD